MFSWNGCEREGRSVGRDRRTRTTSWMVERLPSSIVWSRLANRKQRRSIRTDSLPPRVHRGPITLPRGGVKKTHGGNAKTTKTQERARVPYSKWHANFPPALKREPRRDPKILFLSGKRGL